jgi:hypothetical protein
MRKITLRGLWMERGKHEAVKIWRILCDVLDPSVNPVSIPAIQIGLVEDVVDHTEYGDVESE